MRSACLLVAFLAGCTTQQLDAACDDYSTDAVSVVLDGSDIQLTLPAGVEDQVAQDEWTCLNVNVFAEDTGTNYWFTWAPLPAALPAAVSVGDEIDGWFEHAENRDLEPGRSYIAQVFVDWIPESGSNYTACELAASDPFAAP